MEMVTPASLPLPSPPSWTTRGAHTQQGPSFPEVLGCSPPAPLHFLLCPLPKHWLTALKQLKDAGGCALTRLRFWKVHLTHLDAASLGPDRCSEMFPKPSSRSLSGKVGMAARGGGAELWGRNSASQA